MRRFAKPLYGLTPVPRVRIPPSPPRSLDCGESWPFFLRNTRKLPVFRDIRKQTGLERTDCSTAKAVTVSAFLWKAHAQSGFKHGIRRQCDHKQVFGP